MSSTYDSDNEAMPAAAAEGRSQPKRKADFQLQLRGARRNESGSGSGSEAEQQQQQYGNEEDGGNKRHHPDGNGSIDAGHQAGSEDDRRAAIGEVSDSSVSGSARESGSDTGNPSRATSGDGGRYPYSDPTRRHRGHGHHGHGHHGHEHHHHRSRPQRRSPTRSHYSQQSQLSQQSQQSNLFQSQSSYASASSSYSDSQTSSRSESSSGESESVDDERERENEASRRAAGEAMRDVGGDAANSLRDGVGYDHDASAPHLYDGGQPLFQCETTRLELISQLLQSLILQGGRDQLATLVIARLGMKVFTSPTASQSSAFAKAYLKKELFSQYQLNPARFPQKRGVGGSGMALEEYAITIKLSLLLSCLQVFGPTGTREPVMQLQIDHEGDPLVVILDCEDSQCHHSVTECELLPMAQEPQQPVQLQPEKLLACVITSKFLVHAFHEIDITGVDVATISAFYTRDKDGNKQEQVTISVIGNGLSLEVDFSRDSNRQIFWENRVQMPMGKPFQCQYKLANLRPCLKAAARSSLSNVRIDGQGSLSIQHVIQDPLNSANSNWLEFFIVCEATPEEEDRGERERDERKAPEKQEEIRASQQQQQQATPSQFQSQQSIHQYSQPPPQSYVSNHENEWR